MLQHSFQPFPLITTERLHLRPLADSDAGEMLRLCSDAAVLEYIFKNPSTTLEEAQGYITMINEQQARNEAVTWAMTLRGEGRMIGTICYRNIQAANHRAELGYMLQPEYWKQGLMQEALSPILFYGFNMMKLHSVEARVSPENTASIRLLERMGFKQEGLLRECVYFNDRYWDMATLGLRER